MKTEYEYNSVIAPHIRGLLEQKRASGYAYANEAAMLKRFDNFCAEQGLASPSLPRDLIMSWAARRPSESLTNRRCRVSPVRQLAIYMDSRGLTVYMPPKRLENQEKHTPYVLNPDEIIALFVVIDNQCPVYEHPLRFIASEKIIFRLYYCCGLRLAEALHLRREHVNFENGTLTILHSKGDKDRLVYMPDDLTAMCRYYYGFIVKECPDSPWLFPGKNPMNPFGQSTFPVNFKRYWLRTPFAGNSAKCPTIHSLRHTFVVDRMNDWMLSGVDLKAMMPYLIRYLGHFTIDDTLYYYHLVNKAFKVIRQADGRANSLIPEATPYEE